MVREPIRLRNGSTPVTSWTSQASCPLAAESHGVGAGSECGYGMLTSACESYETEAAHLAPSLFRALSWGVALVHVANRATALIADASSPRVDQHAPVVADAPRGTSVAAAHHRLNDSDRPGPHRTAGSGRPQSSACVRPAAPVPNDSFSALAVAGRATPWRRSSDARPPSPADRSGTGSPLAVLAATKSWLLCIVSEPQHRIRRTVLV